MTESRVSIIIPCYNAARWLPAALESALAQTHRPCEIILIDDGSDDDSLAVARTYAPRGVQVYAQPNRGAASARNHGIAVARGAFVQFLDADDLLAPDKIARQLALLATAPALAIAAGPWGRFQRDPATAVFTPEQNWRDLPAVDWLALNFAGRGMMPPAAWLFPRALADAAGRWDERLTLNDDGEYFCRVLLASSGVRFCVEARSFYRSSLAGSLSARRTPAAWQSALLSHELCSRHLLARESSPRTRRACADLFQRLAHTMFPACPAQVRICEDRVRAYGGSDIRPGGGVIFRLFSRLAGWKSARRLQLLLALR